LALVALSVVEQRLDAVRAVLSGAKVTEVAAAAGVSRQSVHCLPPAPARWQGGPVEFDRVVPASGNMWVAGRQFWLGPARAGTVIRFWADCQLIHLSAGGARIKTLRSHLSVSDLAKLAATGAVPAGPALLPPAEDGHPAGATAPARQPSPSGCSAAPPPPASSWSAGRRSPSAASTRGRP
jgi:hypothetical protein